MRKTALKTLVVATFGILPLAAGFAFLPSAVNAQNMPPMGASSADAALLRMGQLETQIRELTGQLEQREFQLRQLQDSFERYVESTNERLNTLEGGRSAAQNPSAQTTGQSPSGFSTSMDSSRPPQPTAPAQNTVNPTDFDAPYNTGNPSGTLGQIDTPASQPDGVVTSGRVQSENPAQSYDTAFGYLQGKNYTDAENAFQDFLKAHPKHALAGNAQYWLGETYYAQTQFTAAARTFAKAFQDYPQGQKAPDALFKLALTLEKMDKREDACLTLAELRKRFPSGPASVLRRADEEGARMQCTG